jgi:hypothetical protein
LRCRSSHAHPLITALPDISGSALEFDESDADTDSDAEGVNQSGNDSCHGYDSGYARDREDISATNESGLQSQSNNANNSFDNGTHASSDNRGRLTLREHDTFSPDGNAVLRRPSASQSCVPGCPTLIVLCILAANISRYCKAVMGTTDWMGRLQHIDFSTACCFLAWYLGQKTCTMARGSGRSSRGRHLLSFGANFG